jgi:hypothetical protein
MKTVFFHKTKSRDASKNANRKAVTAVFTVDAFQSSILRQG